MTDEPKALVPATREGEMEAPPGPDWLEGELLEPPDPDWAWVEKACEYIAGWSPTLPSVLNHETKVRLLQNIPGYAPPRPFNPDPDAGDA